MEAPGSSRAQPEADCALLLPNKANRRQGPTEGALWCCHTTHPGPAAKTARRPCSPASTKPVPTRHRQMVGAGHSQPGLQDGPLHPPPPPPRAAVATSASPRAAAVASCALRTTMLRSLCSSEVPSHADGAYAPPNSQACRTDSHKTRLSPHPHPHGLPLLPAHRRLLPLLPAAPYAPQCCAPCAALRCYADGACAPPNSQDCRTDSHKIQPQSPPPPPRAAAAAGASPPAAAAASCAFRTAMLRSLWSSDATGRL